MVPTIPLSVFPSIAPGTHAPVEGTPKAVLLTTIRRTRKLDGEVSWGVLKGVNRHSARPGLECCGHTLDHLKRNLVLVALETGFDIYDMIEHNDLVAITFGSLDVLSHALVGREDFGNSDIHPFKEGGAKEQVAPSAGHLTLFVVVGVLPTTITVHVMGTDNQAAMFIGSGRLARARQPTVDVAARHGSTGAGVDSGIH